MEKHLDTFKSELCAKYVLQEESKAVLSFVTETMEKTVKSGHEAFKVDPRVYFLLDMQRTETNKYAPIVNIDKAFESPQTHSECFTFLRKYAEDSFSKAACLVSPKSIISYPQVWKGQGSRKWKHGQHDGFFVLFDPHSYGNCGLFPVPLRREKPCAGFLFLLLVQDPVAVDISAHELVPRIYKEKQ
ncbi:hypothetical protein MLD38_039604 [Melastoma candidum]|uniref:Uncharacterized protein n=1 Tax=Melastoma candidum TaxID=119954 RepID=A0ACB9L3H7_9MYRT|nr:hypothetical protein MLD38_039604 [Melastoma candidum]